MSAHSLRNKATATLQTAYVDLATLEGNPMRLYAGDACTTPFSRDIEKSSWFSTMWVPLKAENSSSEAPVWKTQKTADFLLKVLFRATVPAVKVKEQYRKLGYQVAATRYMAHNIIGQAEMFFSDLKAQSMDSRYLDYYASLFTKDYGKWILYNRMVGNLPEVVEFSDAIPEFTVKTFLPFSFTKSPSDALKLCCTKLVDTKFNLYLNNELGRLFRVRRQVKTKDGQVNWEYIPGDVSEYLEFEGKSNKIKNVELWGKYALVTNEERDFHKSETHSVVLEQTMNYDHASAQVGSGTINAPFHWNGAVKAIMFGVVNKTAEKYNNYSNYTTNAHDVSAGKDPIKNVSIQYDSQFRSQNMPADMYSEIECMDTFPNGTPETGIHGMSYSLEPYSNDPRGATVFDRLMTTFIVDVEDQPAFENGERDLKLSMPNEYTLVMRGIVETVFVMESLSIKIPTGTMDA